MELRVTFHICQWVWLLSCDHMDVEGSRVIQNSDVPLRVIRWRVCVKVLVLEVQVELCASIAEDCSEEDDEEEGERDGPEDVALATVPTLEVSTDYRVDSAPHG